MNSPKARWPKKCDLFGVQVSATNYDEALDCNLDAARNRRSAAVTAFAVHGLVTAARNKVYCEKINAFDIVSPDGQPVRWALNRFHRTGLGDRVYGPELMLRACRRAAKEG